MRPRLTCHPTPEASPPPLLYVQCTVTDWDWTRLTCLRYASSPWRERKVRGVIVCGYPERHESFGVPTRCKYDTVYIL